MLINFPETEAIHEDPEVAALLQQGWTIKSATPRIIESGEAKLLVVMATTGTMVH